MGLVVAYTWNREKQMFVALGKEFDMFIKHPLIRLPMHISFELKWLLRLPVAAAADVQTIESPINL